MTEEEANVARALDGWRQAERDLATANANRAASTHAVEVAAHAEEAAIRTAESAKLALAAASSAEESARATADAARELTAAAHREESEMVDLAEAAGAAEVTARDVYQAAAEAARERNG